MAITLNYSDIELAEFNETAYNNLWLQQINQALQYLDNAAGQLQLPIVIQAPTDGEEYIILPNTRFPLTVKNIILWTDAGTLTLNAKIGATNITGLSAVSVTSTRATTTATAANTMVANDDLIITPSSVTGANWLYGNVTCNRTGIGTV
jgi:hypothetical protein